MKMRFALAGSCRREDIPACGRGRGTGLLGTFATAEGRQLPRVEFTCPKGKSSGAPSPSILRQTLSLSGEGEMTNKGIGQRHLSSHRRSGPNLIKGCLALPKGVKYKVFLTARRLKHSALISDLQGPKQRIDFANLSLTEVNIITELEYYNRTGKGIP
ncbi:hypothetical protein TSUD_199070 [Trifolium subterraneum]|uniref:Uncharacterized protein n=1 Tax=Trifolium subterraneum TaxID=3900 RepID=A0A2Z6MSR4_TRISU|nr:hypothetical protein TSUD_199070 [Trifolium subterraneum]